VRPAWVASGPPNFAPEIVSPVTLYDVISNTFRSKTEEKPKPVVYFRRHILPLLKQLSNTQWVNHGFAMMFGYDAPFDFEFDEKLIKKLAFRGDGSKADVDLYGEFRRHIYNNLRKPGGEYVRHLWPPIYGDNAEDNVDEFDDRKWSYLTITKEQWDAFIEWRDGNFVDDTQDATEEISFDKIPPAQQPATLTQAALHFCAGGAFHPGIELPWLMRLPSVYEHGLRVRVDHEKTNPDYPDGPTLGYPATESYPYAAQGPGDLTRWMAVPWQCDTFGCRAGYMTKFEKERYSFHLASFWPSRAPNTVLSEEDWNILSNTSLKPEARTKAFHRRANWLRGAKSIPQLTTEWWCFGVVLKKTLPDKPDFLPQEVYVESGLAFEHTTKLTEEEVAEVNYQVLHTISRRHNELRKKRVIS